MFFKIILSRNIKKNVLASAELKGELMAKPLICSHGVLLKLNSTDIVVAVSKSVSGIVGGTTFLL